VIESLRYREAEILTAREAVISIRKAIIQGKEFY
jgi:hypothetical protein